MEALRLLTLAAGSVVLAALPVLAQVSASNVRALNVARQWAINRNGGLSVYVPASCMFETGTGGGSCLVQNNSQGFVFRFRGGAPGWQQNGQPATTLTEIQVSPDGRSVVNVTYNGAPR
ncbi:MAG: hypothetical protein ACKOE9_03205 [Vulcanococcus sp.]